MLLQGNYSLLIKEVKYNRRKQKCQLILNDNSLLYLSTDIINKYYLTPGKNLNDKMLSDISKEQRIYDLKQAALNYSSYKLRTEWLVIEKLKSKGFEDDEIKLAIQFLKEFNLLDDRGYARSFIKDYLLKKPAGKRRIFDELKKRGIASDIAQEALDETFPESNKYELALKSAEKKIRLISNKNKDKQKQLIINHLKRLGFEWNTIKSTLNKLFE